MRGGQTRAFVAAGLSLALLGGGWSWLRSMPQAQAQGQRPQRTGSFDWNAARAKAIPTPKLKGPDGSALQFYVVNDVVMGGRSLSDARTSENGGLVFSGMVNTDGGGFASVRADLPNGLSPDITAVAVTTSRGDGREYKLTLQAQPAGQPTDSPLLSYAGTFQTNPEGQSVRAVFRLTELSPSLRGRPVPGAGPPDAGSVQAVGLLLNHLRGANWERFGAGQHAFSLHVEDIEWLRKDEEPVFSSRNAPKALVKPSRL
eukprot:g57601.t1